MQFDQLKRREFIALLGGAATAWPLAARAQDAPGKVARVGIIDNSPSWDSFRQQLRELNYVEGQNIAYVYLRTDGSPAQLDAAAAALVQVHVNPRRPFLSLQYRSAIQSPPA